MAKFLVILGALVVAAAARRQFQQNSGPFGRNSRQEFYGPLGNWGNEMNEFGNGRPGQMLPPQDGFGFPGQRPGQEFSPENNFNEFMGPRPGRFPRPGRGGNPNGGEFSHHGHKPHHPPFPPFFANLTEEDLRQFFSIVKDRNLTKQQRDDKLSEWAAAKGKEFVVSY